MSVIASPSALRRLYLLGFFRTAAPIVPHIEHSMIDLNSASGHPCGH
jgi:hypothetical protein